MTEKEKALELVSKFHGRIADCGGFIKTMPRPVAKQSALICVDEMIKELQDVEFNYDLHNHNENSLENTVIKYWQQVKQEINKS